MVFFKKLFNSSRGTKKRMGFDFRRTIHTNPAGTNVNIPEEDKEQSRKANILHCIEKCVELLVTMVVFACITIMFCTITDFVAKILDTLGVIVV